MEALSHMKPSSTSNF